MYFVLKMNKKAVALSLETIIIAIIVLVVLAMVLFFIVKFGGSAGSSIGDQAKNAADLLPNITTP